MSMSYAESRRDSKKLHIAILKDFIRMSRDEIAFYQKEISACHDPEALAMLKELVTITNKEIANNRDEIRRILNDE